MENLSQYEFESTQQNANNKKFRFMEYLYSGDYVEVIKEFKDYYGFTHQVGEKFYFACVYFLPHEDGYTLYISKDKINISNIFLQDRAETQKEICCNLKEYFKVIEQGRFKRDQIINIIHFTRNWVSEGGMLTRNSKLTAEQTKYLLAWSDIIETCFIYLLEDASDIAFTDYTAYCNNEYF